MDMYSTLLVYSIILLCLVLQSRATIRPEWISTAQCVGYCGDVMDTDEVRSNCDSNSQCQQCQERCQSAYSNPMACRPSAILFCNPGCKQACQFINNRDTATRSNTTYGFPEPLDVRVQADDHIACSWTRPVGDGGEIEEHVTVVYVVLWKDLMEMTDWQLAVMTEETHLTLSPISDDDPYYQHFNFKVIAVTADEGIIAQSATTMPTVTVKPTPEPEVLVPTASPNNTDNVIAAQLERAPEQSALDLSTMSEEEIREEIFKNGLSGVSMELYPLRPKSDEIHIAARDMVSKQEFKAIEESELEAKPYFNPIVAVHSSVDGTANAVVSWNITQTRALSSRVEGGGTVLLHWGRKHCYGNYMTNPRCAFDLNTHWLTRMAPILDEVESTAEIPLEQLMFNSIYWVQLKTDNFTSDVVKFLTPSCISTQDWTMERCNDSIPTPHPMMLQMTLQPTTPVLLAESAFKLIPVIVFAVVMILCSLLVTYYFYRRCAYRLKAKSLEHNQFQDTYSAVGRTDDYPLDTMVTYNEEHPTQYSVTSCDPQYASEDADKSSGISSYATQTNGDQESQTGNLSRLPPLWLDCDPSDTILQRMKRRHSTLAMSDIEPEVDIKDYKINHLSNSCTNLVVHRPDVDDTWSNIPAAHRSASAASDVNKSTDVIGSISSVLSSVSIYDNMESNLSRSSSHKDYLYLTHVADDLDNEVDV